MHRPPYRPPADQGYTDFTVGRSGRQRSRGAARDGVRQRARQRRAAHFLASARDLARRGPARPRGALELSPMVDRRGPRRLARRLGSRTDRGQYARTIDAAREPPPHDGPGLSARTRRCRHRRHARGRRCARRDRAEPPASGRPAPRLFRRRGLGAGQRRPTRRPAARRDRRHASARRLRGARRQDRNICSNARTSNSSPSNRARNVRRVSATICAGSGSKRSSRSAMPRTRITGGTASRSIACSPTCLVQPRASCAATPISAGSGARATSRRWPPNSGASSRRSGTSWQPGGELLYVTCSIFPEEGEEQAQWFEGAQKDAVRLDAPGQLLPLGRPGFRGPRRARPRRRPRRRRRGGRRGIGIQSRRLFYARFLKR